MLVKSIASHLVLILMTLMRTLKSLIEARLSILIPLFLGLMLAAVMLFFIQSVSPIAPFVYSLF